MSNLPDNFSSHAFDSYWGDDDGHMAAEHNELHNVHELYKDVAKAICDVVIKRGLYVEHETLLEVMETLIEGMECQYKDASDRLYAADCPSSAYPENSKKLCMDLAVGTMTKCISGMFRLRLLKGVDKETPEQFLARIKGARNA